jgi:ABC-type transport system involved in multi-copper enzyme maturation permease subunit
MIDVVTSQAQRPAASEPALAAIAPPRLGPAWRAMLWKEARETILFAAIMALLVGVVLGWLVVVESRSIANGNGNYYTAGDAFLNGAITILGPLAALVLGAAQFIMESRPDRFGFVVHRPVSRAQLFWSKVVTGLGLYLVAMLIPPAIAMAWASRPYNIPLPFTWDMALPVLSDIAAGIPFYFAAVLVARRSESGWVGSRLLPAAAPILSAAASYAVPGFGWSLLFTLGAAAIVITPAYGLYVAGGQYRPMGRPAKATLTVIIGIALIMTGALAIALVDELLRFNRASARYEQATLAFDKQGLPVILHQDNSGWFVTDLQSTRLPKPEMPNRTTASSDMLLQTTSIYDDISTRFQPHTPTCYFAPVTYDQDGVSWFRRTGGTGDYLVGYGRLSRRLVGAIGVHGFEPGVAVPRAPFAGPLNVVTYSLGGSRSRHWLISGGDTLYRLQPDLKLEPIYKAPEAIRRLAIRGVGPASDSDGPMTALFPLLQTERQLIILSSDASPKPLVQFPIAPLDESYVAVGRIPATETFVVLKSAYRSYSGTLKPHAYFFDVQGRLDHDQELPIVATFTPNHSYLDYLAPALAPPAFVGFAVPMDAARMASHGYYNDPQIAQIERYYQVVSVLIAVAAGVASAAGLFLLTRSRNLPRRAVWLWTLLGLFLGPVVLLMLLCTRGLPRRTPCPQCHKPIAVTEDTCARCHTRLPAPATTGTEIFA